MAQLVLRIKLNEGNDVLLGFTADKIVNNVSTLIGNDTTDNNGIFGKSLATGKLLLNDGYLGGRDTTLQSEIEKYNGFMFGATNSKGEYEVKLSLQGTNLDKIIITGDKNANQFPTKAILDEGTAQEKTIYSDDASWAIAFEQESDSHIIKFTNWNKANYNACFTTLKVLLKYLDLGNNYINEINSLSEIALNDKDIPYSLISNNGNTKINDIDGEFKDYLLDGIIPKKNMEIEFLINNSLVQKHIVTDTEYDTNSKLMSFEMSNKLDKFSTYNYKGYGTGKGSCTAYDIIQNILSSIGYTDEEIEYSLNEKITLKNPNNNSTLFVGTIYNYLKNITINNYYISEQNLDSAINKFCQAFLLRVYEDDYGKLKFISCLPMKNDDDKIIKIEEFQIFDKINENILPENDINRIIVNTKKTATKTLFQKGDYTAEEAITYHDDEFLTKTENIAHEKALSSIPNNYYYEYYDTIFPVGWGARYIIGYYKENAIEKAGYIGLDYNLIQQQDKSYIEATPFSAASFPIYGELKYKKASTSIYGSFESFKSDFINNIPKTVEHHPEESDGVYMRTGILHRLDLKGENTFFFGCRVGTLSQDDTGTYSAIYLFNDLRIKYGISSSVRQLIDGNKNRFGSEESDINELSISDNEIIQDTTQIFGMPISNYIAKMLLYYYKNPLQTISLNLFCTNYYDLEGNLIINYDSGEIIPCNKLIKINKIRDIYSIYSREIQYNGGAPVLSIKAIALPEL